MFITYIATLNVLLYYTEVVDVSLHHISPESKQNYSSWSIMYIFFGMIAMTIYHIDIYTTS